MTRQQIFNAVYELAVMLCQNGQTMTFDDLCQWLNNNGFRRPRWNEPYETGRGVAKLVSCTYGYVCNELGLGHAGAKPVAEAFTNQNGRYAYD